MKKPRIATLGYLLNDWLIAVEHFPVALGEHQTLNEARIEPGGMCNFLIAGQRLGGEMVALDAIGADQQAEMLLQALALEGVDCSQVVKIAGARSRLVVVLSDPEDRHVFMSYQGDALPQQVFSKEWRETLAAVDGFYLDGFSLGQEYIRLTAIEAAREVHQRGGRVFFDPGPGAADLSKEILQDVDCVLLTEEELSAWEGGEGIAGAHTLLKVGPKWVVIKQGGAGCTIVSKNQSIKIPGKKVSVRDTMGAGDVFNAAFTIALLQGKPLTKCGDFANAAGAVQVQKFGAGRNVPTLEEVNRMRDL